ncbi:MAG: PorV/PorQ family protein [Endomicrobiales bacterium]|nr:PorV/PorQ family protein [Endomicrobiales bacterium]
MKKILLAATFTVFLANQVFGGTGAAAFLDVGVGARALGMGGAFVSVADDPSTVYWNPAGLGRLNRFSFTAMSQSLASSKWETLEDITPSYQFFALTIPVNTFGLPFIGNETNTFGIGMISCGLDSIPYTYLGSSGQIVRETFKDTENAYFISYGVPIFDESAEGLYAGTTLKFITQKFSKIDGASATGYDMDFGFMYNSMNFNIAMMVERGACMSWANGRSDTAPTTAKLGVSNKFWFKQSYSILAVGDLVQRQNSPLTLNAGAEFGYERESGNRRLKFEGIFARLGVEGYALENRYGYASKINEDINLTAGLGLRLVTFGYSIDLDYAFGSYRLGDKNRISLSLYF